jgi:predicted nucleic acid-binding protein
MRLLVDTSVLITWFHDAGEAELAEARAIRDAHVHSELDAHVLDLAIYEFGNVLARALKWTARDVADQLDDLLEIVGPPLAMSQAWLREAAVLA